MDQCIFVCLVPKCLVSKRKEVLTLQFLIVGNCITCSGAA